MIMSAFEGLNQLLIQYSRIITSWPLLFIIPAIYCKPLHTNFLPKCFGATLLQKPLALKFCNYAK